MKVELFPFQKRALGELRMKSAEAVYRYQRTHSNQVVSFTAPTGAGKTIIMAALIESIFYGDEAYPEQPEAIVVWLSDSPQLNEQSKDKIDLKADKIRLGQCVTVQDDSFDQEMFDDGHIYFLNTQKLGKSSNLTKHTDNRQYTIWETLANTAREKSDRLYFIIDEAHRGMQGREAGRATTIMQKFLKGSPADGIEAMPVVIGMSATSARFNSLVQGIASDTQYVIVTTDEVRASGLLKDRIVISYPEENTGNRDMAVLQAAADEWKDKWDHWYQYCYEQHYAYVNPVLVIQVQNATSSSVSATDLDDCVAKVEERTGIQFQEGEVVHTFGDANNVIKINGLNVPYVAPSAIAEDKRIRVVFFKESLSTGWDCPRAETMMSFRHATDATYIAQLLGRMIRTPMQMHIQVDETLNDVHLYLPYFNSDTVKEVVEELQNAEGGDIPADIYGESLDTRVMDTLSVRPRSTPNDDCYERLLAYAEKAFHKMNDNYRRKIVGLGDRFIKQYDAIVSNGDVVSKHNFRLPETISLPHEVNGKDYEDHLFVDDHGKARINLNNWEEGVLIEEQGQTDYVCWLRNPPRKPWSLCIPYEMGGEQKPAYPDFIIIRKDCDDEYVVDILEPHDPTRIDNLGKARGFAEYARQNPGVGRIQLIRMAKDAVGHNRFKRLDMAMSAVRDKVSHAMTNDELDHIFDTDGFFMD